MHPAESPSSGEAAPRPGSEGKERWRAASGRLPGEVPVDRNFPPSSRRLRASSSPEHPPAFRRRTALKPTSCPWCAPRCSVWALGCLIIRPGPPDPGSGSRRPGACRGGAAAPPSPVCGQDHLSSQLGPAGDSPPDGGTDRRADDHVAGEMNARVNPGVSHGGGENQQGRGGTRQAAAHAGRECEPGSSMPGRKRSRGRHGNQPGGRNVRGRPVWSLSRAHEFDPDVDGRRGGAHGHDSPHGRPPAVRPAENRDSGRDREPDAREISGLGEPPRWLVEPRGRECGDRRVERLIGGAKPASAGTEQAAPWPGAGGRHAGPRKLRRLGASLACAHNQMLATARAGPGRPGSAARGGHG
jgi:hypothetical protein